MLGDEESRVEWTDELVVWPITIFTFFLLWPLLKKHRGYFIIIGSLLFTPCIVYYKGMGFVKLWPLIACLPAYFMELPEGGLDLVIYYLVLPSLVTGAIFWGLSYYMIPRKNAT